MTQAVANQVAVDRQDFYGIGPPTSIDQWVADNLRSAPPISADQAASLADILASART